MTKLFDIQTLLQQRAAHLSESEVQRLTQRAIVVMAERSALGTVIIPLCFVLGVVSTGYSAEKPLVGMLLALGLVAGTVMRASAIRLILRDQTVISSSMLSLFGLGCLFMAATWGIFISLFMLNYSTGFPLILVLILSAGMAAGGVANFCVWKRLGLIYLLFMISPAILVGLSSGQNELLAVVAGMTIYAMFIINQYNHWSYQFWDTLLTSYLYEREVNQLSIVNEELVKAAIKEKEVIQELEQERAKMRELFDHSGDGIVICDLESRVVEYNQKASQMLHLKKEPIVNPRFFELYKEFEPVSTVYNDYWSLVKEEGETNFECVQLEGDGITRSALMVNLRRFSWQESEAVFVSIRDITARRQAEESLVLTRKVLAKSEGYFEAILRNIELPIYCKDLDGRYLTVNTPFEVLCGVKNSELKGRKDSDIFPLDIGDFFSYKDAEIVDDHRSVELEQTFTLAGIERNLLVHKFPLKERNGKVYGIAGICTDVTTMKKALRAAQLTNEAKTEFLARMSHELRTPMHSILSVARLGLKRAADGPREKLESYFKMIVVSGDQLLRLLSNLLDISMLDSPHSAYQMQQGDLDKDLMEIVLEFQPVMDEKKVQLVYSSAGRPAKAMYDRVKIFQVFRNLLFNALKFSGSGKEIRVEVEKLSAETRAELRTAWKIEVIDQGIGVEQDEVEAIFEKFFQGSKTRSSSEGVGLGLSICKQIIVDHGGTIWAEKNEYGGATFCVLLPVAK